MTEQDQKYIQEQVSEVPILQTLSPEELEQILAYTELKTYSENTTLFEEGDRGDYICFVLEGTIDIRKASVSGHQTIMAKFGRGSIVGEMAAVDLYPRSATARVTSNSKLLILSRDNFEKISQDFPQLSIKILREIARILSLRLRRSSGRFSDFF